MCHFLPGDRLKKYAATSRFRLQSFITADKALRPDASTTTKNSFAALLNSAVSKSTWEKYGSGLNAFSCFEAASCTSFSWPLSLETCREFVVWCHYTRRLAPGTTKAYLSAIKFVHHLRGMSCQHISDDPTIVLLLRGSTHLALSTPPNNTRRVVTFPLLLVLRHRIAGTDWDPLTKQVIWAASTTAFFGSTRMGEILASESGAHSPSSDLTWNDVRESSGTSLLIRLKQPKSGEAVEFVDLFPFPHHNCCPVLALKNLRKKQLAADMSDTSLPVFRFGTGKNLTMQQFNETLSLLLPDLCSTGVQTIKCHSFRPGIPSTLSLFPELATADLVKGWGRWKSDCYMRYTRLKLPQRLNIFEKISAALLSTSSAV